ncbi:MAG TPA: DUF2958 domain-containing protein [Sphingomicrobium sp.]|nr:DUF2958 domain-containing protein [Sphingomicrobium sp.]
MTLPLSDAIRAELLANGKKTKAGGDHDLRPVVKLFTPDANCTWLLTEIDSDDPDLAFGLCDLGLGYPELGLVSLAALASVRGRFGLPVERDTSFRPNRTLNAYADAASDAGRIVT